MPMFRMRFRQVKAWWIRRRRRAAERVRVRKHFNLYATVPEGYEHYAQWAENYCLVQSPMLGGAWIGPQLR